MACKGCRDKKTKDSRAKCRICKNPISVSNCYVWGRGKICEYCYLKMQKEHDRIERMLEGKE